MSVKDKKYLNPDHRKKFYKTFLIQNCDVWEIDRPNTSTLFACNCSPKRENYGQFKETCYKMQLEQYNHL